tara:strand:- start:1477 stop:3207 length:1731 start_codon:yes stop_codon:yes gene_type:complete
MLKDYFEVPNKPATKSGNVLSCDFTDHETFIPQPLDFTRNTLATYVDCNGTIKVSGVSDTELVTNGDFSNGSTDWDIDPAWSIANGKAFYDETINSQRLKQTLVTDASKTYQIKFTISGVEPGKFARFALWVLSNASSKFFTYTQFKDGDYVIYASPDGPNGNVFHFNALNAASNDSSFYITNISLKEVNLNVPRIDYLTEIGKAKELQKPSLLLEPQSTNTATYSNNFTKGDIFDGSSSPNANNSVLTASSITVPDGTNSSWKLTDNNDGSIGASQLAYYATTVTSGDTNTFSIFLKKGSTDFAYLSTGGFDASANGQTFFNLNTGTVSSASVNHSNIKIENYGNGWYRCSISNLTTTDVQGSFVIGMATLSSNFNITRDGSNFLYMFGVQAETTGYCTSYIPTFNSTVTRNVELCDNAGQRGVFNNQEGTMYVEFTELGFANPNQTSIGISQESSSNNRLLLFRGGGSNWSFQVRAASVNAMSNSINLTTTETLNKFAKVAIRYKTGEITAFVNGSQSFTNNSTFTFNGKLDKFGFIPYDGSTGNNFYGRVKDVKVFRRTLTDSEMAELTNNIT